MFVVIVFLGVLTPIISLVILLMLRLLDHELNILELENVKVQLEKELQASEYNQLSKQIEPHFLFNTLNAFLSLSRMERYGDMTKGMERFALFLRHRYKDQEHLVSFQSELEHTNNYLAIQQLRFGTKLEIEYNIENDALRSLIPSYTLQTLVENAFKHGLEKRTGVKYCKISFKRKGNWVVLTVIDNGTEEIDGFTEHGVGLANIRRRFELLFDLLSSLTLYKNKKKQTVAIARWPYVPGDEADERTNRR